MNKKFLSMTLAVAMMLSLLAACGSSNTGSSATTTPDATATPAVATTNATNLSVCIASEPQTIDPALNSSVDGGILVQHTFEGLFKWSDAGSEIAPGINAAEITEGQVASYDKLVNEDGTVTYTFHLRDDIFWSDGVEVTAGDFVYAWQRLANPSTAADYCYMIDMVVGYDAIAYGVDNGATDEAGAPVLEYADPTTLGVSAPDDKTFVVDIVNDSAYFLEICAFPATYPVRQDIIEAYGDQWTFDTATYIGNGPYVMTDWTHNASITMAQSETYYGVADLGPETITFQLMDDANAMLAAYNSGELAFIQDAPVDEIPSLMVSGELDILDYIGTYYMSYQTQQYPFDDARVRQAFTLAIDNLYIVEKVTQRGETPAGGFVPAGIYDAQGATGDDFRTVGGDYWNLPTDDDIYAANLAEANRLLDEAGYEDRSTFPVVEYLYNTNDGHKAIAEALQNMWGEGLGVTVTLANQDWAVFLESRKQGDYQIARNGWIADYNDPQTFLDMWLTGGGNNDAQYANAEYDSYIAAAKATADPEERMAALHAAEDIIIGEDWALAPLYFYTQMMMLKDDLTGMYYAPLGYYFFDQVTTAN